MMVTQRGTHLARRMLMETEKEKQRGKPRVILKPKGFVREILRERQMG